jgi:regulator of protease activity HflC (stomatin/prohibitin superfamily)
MTQEKVLRPQSGWSWLAICLVLLLGGPALFVNAAVAAATTPASPTLPLVLAVVMILSGIVLLFGLQAVAPNDARVLLLFGEYKGSITQSGFFWVNPFYSKKKITLRIRNFETGAITVPQVKDAAGTVIQHKSRTAGRPSKVNDRDGNPIEISAVVVWKVVNTAEALFEVDDYEHYVAVQSEAALRNLAQRHPYDSEDHEISLRGNTVEVCDQLQHDIQDRLDKAGVAVLEARISHLAYAPEIAAAMLQRQQAQAVVAARTKIVEGAVGMVQMALDHLAKDHVVELDDERRASMVSNLLVVLCSDRHTQPVVNTGTLYG